MITVGPNQVDIPTPEQTAPSDQAMPPHSDWRDRTPRCSRRDYRSYSHLTPEDKHATGDCQSVAFSNYGTGKSTDRSQ